MFPCFKKVKKLTVVSVHFSNVTLRMNTTYLTSIPFYVFQKDGGSSKRDTVVLLLQDMLEVVTRDMMVNEIRSVMNALV